MMQVERAFQVIMGSIHPLEPEWISTSAALDRILAETVLSPSDFPAADISSMDGYAMRYQDGCAAPCELQVMETIPAGHLPSQTVQAGQTSRLFTGSLLPPGADTVIIQENTQVLGDGRVKIVQPANQLGQFVRKQGHYCRQGDPILRAGLALGPAELGVLAALGRSVIPVGQRPQVALFSTGNELVRLDQLPQAGQIVDSNQYALWAAIHKAGGIPTSWGILPDDPQCLGTTMQSSIQRADVVISSGGVSVGDYDYVEKLLAELGGQILIHSIAIKPGKPLTFAIFEKDPHRRCYFFGLPGNPVSALVTFWRFVQPALAKLQSQAPPWDPRCLTALAQSDLSGDGKRETYLWGSLNWQSDPPLFTPVLDYQSGNLINLAGCNGLAVVPVGVTGIAAQQPVRVMLLK
ncbi:MAG: molybdopterin molybdotransferase MoeA [Cyanobacteriota bacterium]|nr:molybdopterin molybdotransferase MoeA [Cyanobacteriota bacterium]